MTTIDEDGLTEAEQLIAAVLYKEYPAPYDNWYPGLYCTDDPRTVAHLLKPFLARVWADGFEAATEYDDFIRDYNPDNPYLDFND